MSMSSSSAALPGRHTAAASTSRTARARSNTTQAEPLPRKVGELGYNPAVHAVPARQDAPSSSETVPLGPHPAERTLSNHDEPTSSISPRTPRTLAHTRTDTSSTASSSEHPHSSDPAHRGRLTTQPAQSSTSLAPSAASMSSISSLKRFTKKLKPSPKPSGSLYGMAPRTVLKFLLLVFFLTGVCASWAIATNANASGHGSIFGGNANSSMNIVVFVHVAFAVITLTVLLFIERTMFRLRAERFSYLHPEMELPTRSPFAGGSLHSHGLSFAPWQRPPLPTYAAAIRTAPTATGDAEDQEVARMVAIGHGDVPPVYGNTRGSTLLAYGLGAGPLANRATSRSSNYSTRGALAVPDADDTGSRPVSYGQSQQIEDALRAQKLEETLSRLEAGP